MPCLQIIIIILYYTYYYIILYCRQTHSHNKRPGTRGSSAGAPSCGSQKSDSQPFSRLQRFCSLYQTPQVCMYICIYMYVYSYMCIFCMVPYFFVYMYLYVYIYIHIPPYPTVPRARQCLWPAEVDPRGRARGYLPLYNGRGLGNNNLTIMLIIMTRIMTIITIELMIIQKSCLR